ncbi:MAG: peptidoglycan DD-metalloendopeptidase family protein [Candidatus Faecousia sp.]|nr:peptidoglycan DD-metalloendopeptidase family protein [Eubacteriales bacterium]MDY6066502.1 peptidoglycan DD-metalloendopeptidase family protein [Candidatus Faecousia sp.]
MKRQRKSKALLGMVLAAALVLSCVPIQAGASEKTDKIEDELGSLKSENADIQAEIDAVRQQYTAASNQIQDLVNRKNAVDQEIALLHSQILNINQQVIAYGQLIADAQDDMDEESQRLDELNEKHKARIRAMEEGGTVSYWEVLFQASSFTDFLDRMAMIEEIAQSDQRRLEEIQQAADDLSSTQAKMQQELRSLAEAQQTLADSESLLAEKRTESDGLLRSLAAQKEEFELLLDDSEAKQDALMEEIAQKEKELANAQYEEKLAKLALQGQNPPSNATWITPVSGYTITSAFGMRIHPVYKYALMHNGIDMACPQGTPIYATRAGTVTTASYQAGGAGYYVSINHGDGFSSIYMHMTNYVVSSGQSVAAGQLIGYVGSTGVSTGPHLHFGVSYAGTYVNPMAYIG